MKKFLCTNKPIENDLLEKLPFKVSKKNEIGGFSIIMEDPASSIETKYLFCNTDGYVRNLSLEAKDPANTTEEILLQEFRSWPFTAEITGSFSSTVIDKNKGEIFLFNDLFGLYPLYYLVEGETFFASNSIIFIGILSGAKTDKVGVIQRSLGPEFANIGSRTILQNCKRLLPGEWIRFNVKGQKMEIRFDNSLYQDLSTPKYDQNILNDYWNGLKKELLFCLNDGPRVNLALSGGVDSRLILGAIPSEKEIICHTFGGNQNYETKIASRLAKAKDAEFKNYEDLSLHFPKIETLQKYTYDTEALYLGSWLEILENVNEISNEPFITGDVTTAITGRTISTFASKKYKRQNFIRSYLLHKEYKFTPSNSKNFEVWKNHIKRKYLRFYGINQFARFKFKIDEQEIREALFSDLNEVFLRIEEHNLPFSELYDEMFVWYTHTRMQCAKQILICSSKFKSYAPAMAVHVLRSASNIHPNRRLNLRFLNDLFREIPELKRLAKIPTNQAPLVPANSANIIKFPIWGMRSVIDKLLIKRLLKKKDPEKRYRLFRSVNWVKVYQNPEMEKNLDQYFIKDHLGKKVVLGVKNQCFSRQALNQWPFANMEVLSIASLNAELQIIDNSRS